MNEKIKIQMVPGEPEQTVLLGNAFHVLEDKTRTEYETKNVDKFFQYIKPIKQITGKQPFVFYNAGGLAIVAQPDPGRIKMNDGIIAICRLDQHPMIGILKKYNPATMEINEFEKFLNSTKSFITSETRDLMDAIKNLSVEKVINVERQKDQSGNFHYAIKSKAGKDDYEFPQQITFEFNPISQIKDKIFQISFDLYFTWDVTGDDPNIRLMFEFSNPELNMLIDDALEFGLEHAVKNKWPDEYLFPGNLDIEEFTDDWKYQTNRLIIRDDSDE